MPSSGVGVRIALPRGVSLPAVPTTMKIIVVLCWHAVAVNGFSAQPIPKQTTLSGTVDHHVGDALSPLHMAFVGGDPVNEDAMACVQSPETTLPLETSPTTLMNTLTLTPVIQSEYAVDQKHSEALLSLWEQPNVWMGRLMALTAAAMYGTNFASIKILNESLPVSLASSLRFGMGALGFTIFVLLTETAADNKVATGSQTELYKERADATWAGAEVGLWYAVGCIAQAVALLEVDASKGAFFNAAAILVVPLLDLVFKGKKLGITGMASVALAMGGMGILQFGDAVASASEVSFVPSDILCAMQAIFFGVGYWRLESSTTRFPAQAQRITLGTLLGLAGGAFSYSLAMGIIPPPEAVFLTLLHFPMMTASLAWTGLGACAGAMYLETVALKAISATELTILMTSVSLFGAAFAWLSMGETMTPSGMAGGALLLAGCLISSLMGDQEENRELEMNFSLGKDNVSSLALDIADVDTTPSFSTELGE